MTNIYFHNVEEVGVHELSDGTYTLDFFNAGGRVYIFFSPKDKCPMAETLDTLGKEVAKLRVWIAEKNVQQSKRWTFKE